MVRTKSSICSSASAGGLTITSTPSPSTLRSKSVTRAATSISASAPRSRPVISQSIHTSRSFTPAPYPCHVQPAALRHVSGSPPSLRGVSVGEGLVRPRRAPGGRRRVGRRRALKLPDPAASVRAVRAYELLPEAVVPVGRPRPARPRGRRRGVPGPRPARAARRGLRAAAGRVRRRHRLGLGARPADRVRLLRRRRPDPDAAAKYPWEIARDVGLLALGVWLVVRPADAARARLRLVPHRHRPRRPRPSRRRKPRWRRRRPRTGPPREGRDAAERDARRDRTERARAQAEERRKAAAQVAADPRRSGRRRARAARRRLLPASPAWAPTSRPPPPAGAAHTACASARPTRR